MRKGFGIIFAVILIAVFVMQVNSVNAKRGDDPITGPITSPISLTPTPPITSPISLTPTPTCKPGWGFGDKNHCHSGPPGRLGEDFPFKFNFKFKFDFPKFFHQFWG